MSWHDDDATWAALEEVLFPPGRIAEAEGEISALLDLARVTPGSAVLDLPCGIGRHSLALAARGLRVTGVDRTACYLARARACSDAVTWVLEDMRRFRVAEAFDVAFNLWTSFGYFEDPADDLVALRNFHASLVAGGRLVMDMNGKEVLARTFRARDWYPFDGGVLLEERALRDDWTWIDSKWTAITEERRFERVISIRPFSASEIRALLFAAGFATVRCYGGFDGRAYDQDARRLVVIAEKAMGRGSPT